MKQYDSLNYTGDLCSVYFSHHGYRKSFKLKLKLGKICFVTCCKMEQIKTYLPNLPSLLCIIYIV